MSGKAIPGVRCSIGGGMQGKKAHLRRTPGVLHHCKGERCNGALGPDQGGKGIDTFTCQILKNIAYFFQNWSDISRTVF